MTTESVVRKALAEVHDPELKKSIINLGMVRDLQVSDGKVSFALALSSAVMELPAVSRS